METPHTLAVAPAVSRRRIWLGVILIAVGLLGHLLAAQEGGTIAYQHHIFGFLLILVVSGGLIAGLAWRFWRGRHDITWLIIGAIQALLGLLVYLERFNIE
jgi:hypothetical protein